MKFATQISPLLNFLIIYQRKEKKQASFPVILYGNGYEQKVISTMPFNDLYAFLTLVDNSPPLPLHPPPFPHPQPL